MKSPAFQWYVNDFLGSGKVAAMSLDEVGAYTLLLNYDWNEVGLPNELAPFSRWLKVSPRKAQALWDVVKPNFVLRGGRWYNPRLEKERAKQVAWAEKSSKGGHAGAKVRWGDGDKGGHAVVTECLIPNGNTPSSSPITTTTPQDSFEPAPPESPRSSRPRAGLVVTGQEGELFAHYRLRHPRRGPPDDSQIRKVRKGFQSFDLEQMKMAVDGNLEDPWAIKTGKHEIGWIFRDNDHISQAIEHYHRANAPLFDDAGKLTADGQRVFGSAA